MKKHRIFLFFLILIFFSLAIVRLVVCNNISTSGTVLGRVNEETLKYETENTMISEKVLHLSSFSVIYEKADKLGFQSKKTAFTVANSLPIALKQ
jgi:cell division protein FtsL